MAHSLKQKLNAGDIFELNTPATLLNHVFGSIINACCKGAWDYT